MFTFFFKESSNFINISDFQFIKKPGLPREVWVDLRGGDSSRPGGGELPEIPPRGPYNPSVALGVGMEHFRAEACSSRGNWKHKQRRAKFLRLFKKEFPAVVWSETAGQVIYCQGERNVAIQRVDGGNQSLGYIYLLCTQRSV